MLDTGLPQFSNSLAGTLPADGVCTENLTPWLKLLPCRDRQGVAALLQNRATLFQARYQVGASGFAPLALKARAATSPSVSGVEFYSIQTMYTSVATFRSHNATSELSSPR